jgi:hypothetical protein
MAMSRSPSSPRADPPALARAGLYSGLVSVFALVPALNRGGVLLALLWVPALLALGCAVVALLSQRTAPVLAPALAALVLALGAIAAILQR